jgi:hypothetical protein
VASDANKKQQIAEYLQNSTNLHINITNSAQMQASPITGSLSRDIITDTDRSTGCRCVSEKSNFFRFVAGDVVFQNGNDRGRREKVEGGNLACRKMLFT